MLCTEMIKGMYQLVFSAGQGKEVGRNGTDADKKGQEIGIATLERVKFQLVAKD